MNELEARQWLRDFADLIARGVNLTNTGIDDKAVEMFTAAINNDLIWSWVWKLMGGLLEDEPLIVGCENETALAADQAGIDPLTIVAIVKALVELWKLFRK